MTQVSAPEHMLQDTMTKLEAALLAPVVSGELQVWIRNAGSTAACDAWRGAGPVAVGGATTHAVSVLTSSPASPLAADEPATLTATASGGAGAYP